MHLPFIPFLPAAGPTAVWSSDFDRPAKAGRVSTKLDGLVERAGLRRCLDQRKGAVKNS